MNSKRVAALACLGALLSYSGLRAGSLRIVLKVDLAKAIGWEDSHWGGTLPVLAMRFSPDGGELAVVAGQWYVGAGQKRSELAVISLGKPMVPVGHWVVPASVWDLMGDDFAANGFSWSSSGVALNLDGVVIHPPIGEQCTDLPYHSVFFGSDRIVGSTGRKVVGRDEWPERITHFGVFSDKCDEVARWDVKENWAITDASEDRGLLAVTQYVSGTAPGSNTSEEPFLVVDAATGHVVQRWPHQVVGGTGRLLFADHGRTVCSSMDIDPPRQTPVRCFDVDTGKLIAEDRHIGGGTPEAAASGAPRVLATDSRAIRNPFEKGDYLERLNRLVVWDFRANREIVSWRPHGVQKWKEAVDPALAEKRKRSGWVRLDRPEGEEMDNYKFALSPDGKYVAEGGNGVIQIYRIVE